MRSHSARRVISGLTTIPVIGLLMACSGPQSPTKRLSADLKVAWELIENIPGKDDKCQAAFIFINTGKSLINDRGPKQLAEKETGLIIPTRLKLIPGKGNAEITNEFANRIGQRELPRLDQFFGGFNYRIPQPGAVKENGMLHVNIAYPGMDVRFTTDGSDPSVQSLLYTGPVRMAGPVRLRAFTSSGRAGKPIEIK